MADNNQDRSQDEGQQGIDRETEQRNRENETGQQQDQQFGQDKSPPSGQQGESAFGQQGQSAGGDTNFAERSEQDEGQESTGLGSSDEGGFVGSGGDQSSDYLTKGEENQDFAAEGQGAQDTSAGRSDIETGQAQDSGSNVDDGSDANR